MGKQFDDEDDNTFGDRIKLLRRKHGLSMDELGLHLGVAKSTLSKYENGLMMPTLDSAKRFAKYFSVTVDWLSGSGSDEDALASVPQPYIEVIRHAMARNISPEKLQQAVDLFSSRS